MSKLVDSGGTFETKLLGCQMSRIVVISSADIVAGIGDSDYLLVEKGANINYIDHDGYTPLMWVCKMTQRSATSIIFILTC